MKQADSQAYRVAFDSASSELGEITAAFERLRTRKMQLEQLVGVLKPLVDKESLTATPGSPAEESAPAAPAAEGKVQPGEVEQRVADPFQRRIDHVLGIGAGIRDVRKYTRQF